MSGYRVILTAAVCLGTAASSWAFDTIKTTQGSSMGIIKRISRYEVEWEKNRVPQKTPVKK